MVRVVHARRQSVPIVNAPLITTGAKSSQPRQVQLSYFHDGRDPILIASNRGEPKHPQWYFSLRAHADPDEYTRLFTLAVNVFAGYGDYRAKTASIGCQIPIFRLKPR